MSEIFNLTLIIFLLLIEIVIIIIILNCFRNYISYVIIIKTERHHCFKFGIIPKTERGQILPHLCNSLMISMKFN